MTAVGGYTREQLRQSYADAWRKHLAGSPLTPLESMIAEVIELHPEYQAMVGNSQAVVDFQPAADGAAENPFLHMGLHLAVREQISIDRPSGIRELRREAGIASGRSARRRARPHGGIGRDPVGGAARRPGAG